MTDDESPADRRFREWQAREALRKAKEDEAREAQIQENIDAGMNDREARGIDSCVVLAVALAGAGAAVAAVVGKAVGSILRL